MESSNLFGCSERLGEKYRGLLANAPCVINYNTAEMKAVSRWRYLKVFRVNKKGRLSAAL